MRDSATDDIFGGMSERLYLERLTDRDLRFLAASAGGFLGSDDGVARLRAEPARIQELMGRSEVFDALFAPWAEHPLVMASPFLVFCVLLAGTQRDLETRPFVHEWVGPRHRIPVFDTESLRKFLDDPLRRVFLADVLASYTHVASGVVWVRDRRGWSRRRFSELDPVRLAALLDVVPSSDRQIVYRRLGDLALFLAGVFPDFVAERLFRPVQVERLDRVLAEILGEPGAAPREDPSHIALLERLGRRSYRMVLAGMSDPQIDLARALGYVAERFDDARRVLNVLASTHLFGVRGQWFASP